MQSLPKDWEFAGVSQIGDLLRLSRDTVSELIRAKRIEAVNVAAAGARPHYRISRAAFDQFLATQSTTTA